MLQKGIIETIENKYTVKVRVPKYDQIKADSMGTKTEDLANGIVCTLPGMNITYSVGDVVLVAFENDELSKPVILGLLYREQESDSVLEIQGIDSSLESINNTLDELNSKSLYTHIKYSNDNGMTFTSLYDPINIEQTTPEEKTSGYRVKSINNISLDPNIEYIYWNIIDDNNVDITQSIPIVTHVHGVNESKNIDINNDYNTQLIKLPFEYKVCDTLDLSFEISMSLEQIKNYYVSLTTDINTIGSVYGDYIGIATSNNGTPSGNTKDYSWSSVTSRHNTVINKTTDDILDRVRNNERDIRGYNEDIFNDDGQLIQSGVGILDAINIGLQDIVLGINRNKIYFGDANSSVDVTTSNININTVTQGEYEFKRVMSNNKPHLILSYTEG